MNPQTLSTLSLLNDLRHSATETLERKHKYPALLLFYSFIDICASLAEEPPSKSNGDRFKSYLSQYALSSWALIRPYDLWAARSSLLHAYSPLGDHTKKPNGAVPIFYFAWPETESEVRKYLASRGYKNFALIDANTIKHIAVSAFNSMWARVETDATFEAVLLKNSTHLLKDLFQYRLEEELVSLEQQVSGKDRTHGNSTTDSQP